MRNIVLSLFDFTGRMVEPWLPIAEAIIIDIKHPGHETPTGRIHKVHLDLRHTPTIPDDLLDRVAILFAFPPCDHLAVSGARWFQGKGLRALSESIAMFATAIEVAEKLNCPYMIENPVSTISTYWRKPDHTFHPHQYLTYSDTDNYSKKTCLWTGNGFVMPTPTTNTKGPPDSRIHEASNNAERKLIRNATPKGFARAVFEANIHHVR